MGIMSLRRLAKKMLAPVVLVLVLCFVVGMVIIGGPNYGGGEAYAYKGPSLKIYGKTVKDSDFNNYLLRASQQASQYAQIKTFSEAEIREAAIGTALQTVAFEREMKKAGSKIKVSNAEVDKIIKKYWPTEEELKSIMDRQGFASKSELRKALVKELQYQKFVQYKARELKITVPKQEVLGMLEEIKVSHILIGTKDSSGKVIRSDAEALKRANEVYAKVKNGGDFGALAKEYSDDPGSKNNAGVIGPTPLEIFKNQMVKEFVTASLALKPGQYSAPVKTQYGYHIIRLESREIPTGKAYKEKYREIENDLLFQKAEYDPRYGQWLQSINKKAEDNMEILDPGLRAYRLMKQEKWEEAAAAFQKAVKKDYYKNKVDIYVDAATVYGKLKQPKKAVALMSKVPEEVRSDVEYQVALAKAYYEDKKVNKAKEILLQFGEEHLDQSQIHQRLKTVFDEWKMTDAVAKEERILAEIEQKEKEELQKYQQNLEQRNSNQTNQTNQTKK